MYKVTTIYERPSENVSYYLETRPELRFEFSDFISVTPELLLLNTVDESPTRQISEAFYADESAFNSVMEKYNAKFPTFFADRDAYNSSVGIITTRTVTEI